MVINTNQGAIKLSEIFTDEAMALLGSAIGEDALTVLRQLILAETDAHKKIAALCTSNRNVQWNGSALTFSDGSSASNIIIKLLHTEHATTRTIDLVLTGSLSAATATTFQALTLANNELLYLELDRDTVLNSGGTLVIENAIDGGSIVAGKTLKKVALSPTTGLPQLTNVAGGQTRTIFIPLAARIDTVGGGQDLWWIFSGQRWQSGTVQIVGSSSGSGDGGTGLINYITNGTFTAGITGWVGYDDGASATPIDGTGSPSANLTISSSSVNPLRGNASGVITKASNSQQGKGVSYDFTIDAADEAKPLKIQFDYEVSSGFTPGDLSDLTVWVYDLDYGVMIQPTPYTIQGGSGNKHRFISTFQTSKSSGGANSRKYRLAFHVATTSTSSWTLKFDAVFCGPQIVSYGSPATDWTDYSLVIGATTTPPTPAGGYGALVINKARWRRVGDSMEIFYNVRQSGAGSAGSGTYLFPLPPGYKIDLNKLGRDNNGQYVCGTAALGSSGNLDVTAHVTVYDPGDSSDNKLAIWNLNGQANGYVGSGNESLGLGNQKYSFEAKVPIVGWSSTVEMSNDTDTRVVAAIASRNTVQNITQNTTTTIVWNNVANDTHGTYDTATGLYKAPVAGYYQISASIQYNSSGAGLANLSVNVLDTDATTVLSFKQLEQKYFAGSTDGIGLVGSTIIYMKAGQYARLRTFQTAANPHPLTGDANNNHFSIHRVSGPSAIASTELVLARYHLGGNYPSIPNGAVSNVIDYRGKVIDTHNAVTVATSAVSPMQAVNTAGHWIFTAPVGGYYRVTATFRFNNGNGWASGEYQSLQIFKAGVTGAFSNYSMLGETFAHTATSPASVNFFPSGTDVVPLLAGERICIVLQHNNSSNQTTHATNTHAHVIVEKIRQ